MLTLKVYYKRKDTGFNGKGKGCLGGVPESSVHELPCVPRLWSRVDSFQFSQHPVWPHTWCIAVQGCSLSLGVPRDLHGPG